MRLVNFSCAIILLLSVCGIIYGQEEEAEEYIDDDGTRTTASSNGGIRTTGFASDVQCDGVTDAKGEPLFKRYEDASTQTIVCFIAIKKWEFDANGRVIVKDEIKLPAPHKLSTVATESNDEALFVAQKFPEVSKGGVIYDLNYFKENGNDRLEWGDKTPASRSIYNWIDENIVVLDSVYQQNRSAKYVVKFKLNDHGDDVFELIDRKKDKATKLPLICSYRISLGNTTANGASVSSRSLRTSSDPELSRPLAKSSTLEVDKSRDNDSVPETTSGFATDDASKNTSSDALGSMPKVTSGFATGDKSENTRSSAQGSMSKVTSGFSTDASEHGNNIVPVECEETLDENGKPLFKKFEDESSGNVACFAAIRKWGFDGDGNVIIKDDIKLPKPYKLEPAKLRTLEEAKFTAEEFVEDSADHKNGIIYNLNYVKDDHDNVDRLVWSDGSSPPFLHSWVKRDDPKRFQAVYEKNKDAKFVVKLSRENNIDVFDLFARGNVDATKFPMICSYRISSSSDHSVGAFGSATGLSSSSAQDSTFAKKDTSGAASTSAQSSASDTTSEVASSSDQSSAPKLTSSSANDTASDVTSDPALRSTAQETSTFTKDTASEDSRISTKGSMPDFARSSGKLGTSKPARSSTQSSILATSASVIERTASKGTESTEVSADSEASDIPTTQSAQVYPEEAFHITRRRYKIIAEWDMTFDSAKAKCQEDGFELASIQSKDENEFIRRILMKFNVEWAYFGLQLINGIHKNIDGSEPSETHWMYLPERNPRMECAIIDKNRGYWAEYPCSFKRYKFPPRIGHAVCKKL